MSEFTSMNETKNETAMLQVVVDNKRELPD